tara:strand:+ start:958 stop:1224 length:267 start_codon:yes stop_codon:yes gene_type:complete
MAYKYELDQARDIGRIARALETMVEGESSLDVRKLEKKVNKSLLENQKSLEKFQNSESESNDEYIIQGWVEALGFVSTLINTLKNERH